MPARRSRFRPARLFAIFTALLSLAVAILWADSYRERKPEPLPDGEPPFPLTMASMLFNLPFHTGDIGMEFTNYLDGSYAFWMCTYRGRLGVLQTYDLQTNAPAQWIDSSWRDFSYRQMDWGFDLELNDDGTLGTIVGSRCRTATLPFWALFLLCAAYPTIYFIRSPLRRRQRRRRGQCLDYGYDLRGSGGKCPECGAAVTDGAVVQPNADATV
jgi:hypothetical protein